MRQWNSRFLYVGLKTVLFAEQFNGLLRLSASCCFTLLLRLSAISDDEKPPARAARPLVLRRTSASGAQFSSFWLSGESAFYTVKSYFLNLHEFARRA
jgi:hypothetical protein